MNSWEAIIYLFCLASKTISTNPALSRGSPVKTLEDIAEGSRSQNPLHSQCEIISRKNDIPPLIDKESTVAQHINLLTKDQDVTNVDINSKRNFKEAFEIGEGPPVKLPDNVKETNFSPHFSSDWGDDLMFFATEWDAFPAHVTDSDSSGIQYDFAFALEGSEYSYYDYYLHNKILNSNNYGLIKQPESLGTLGRSSSKGVADTQFPEHLILAESSLPRNLHVNKIIEAETTTGFPENSYKVIADNFRLTHQIKAKESYGEGESSNYMYENPHLFNFKKDPIISHQTRTAKAKINKNKTIDLPILQKQQSQKFHFKNKDNLEDKYLPQSIQSSAKFYVRQSNPIKKNDKKDQLKIKGINIKKNSAQEKRLTDAIHGFQLNHKDLIKSRPEKNLLRLFIEALDNFADNESYEYVPNPINVLQPEYLERYLHNPFVKSFLSQRGTPISRSQFVALDAAYEMKNGKEDKKLNDLFFLNDGEFFR
ncbi:hypothetical protein BY996DRAFT_6540174 [Phakopsora pachyrhizi]|nr:hypothetical protein BY996DRAFT_6540174 [Phakopsora pachyrhizi]